MTDKTKYIIIAILFPLLAYVGFKLRIAEIRYFAGTCNCTHTCTQK
jgi:hypothetical protein